MATSGLKGWYRIMFDGAEPSTRSRILALTCGAAAFALSLIVGGALPVRTLPPLMREPGTRMILGIGLAVVTALIAVRFAEAGLRRVVRERPGALTSIVALLAGVALAAVGFATVLAIWDMQGAVRVFMGFPAALGVVLMLTGGLGLAAEGIAMRTHDMAAAEEEPAEVTLAEALGTSPEEALSTLSTALAKREQRRDLEAREHVVRAIMTGAAVVDPEPAVARRTTRRTRGGKGIVFCCPRCEYRMVVPVAWAGRRGRCPSCKAAAELPALSASWA